MFSKVHSGSSMKSILFGRQCRIRLEEGQLETLVARGYIKEGGEEAVICSLKCSFNFFMSFSPQSLGYIS